MPRVSARFHLTLFGCFLVVRGQNGDNFQASEPSGTCKRLYVSLWKLTKHFLNSTWLGARLQQPGPLLFASAFPQNDRINVFGLDAQLLQKFLGSLGIVGIELVQMVVHTAIVSRRPAVI